MPESSLAPPAGPGIYARPAFQGIRDALSNLGKLANMSKQTEKDVPIIWAPEDWGLAHFPLPASGGEILRIDTVVEMLLAHVRRSTEADTTPLCQVLHVAHMLKTLQGGDGQWPAAMNAQTGQMLETGRTLAPVRLFRRLNALLNSTEFDCAIECARAAIPESLPDP